MSDFDDDEVVIVGQRLARIVSVSPLDELHVAVTWAPGTRVREREVVDLGPAVARFKLYASLRDDPALFATVGVQEHGFGVVWGHGEVDMASTTIADAADETMAAEDFSAFMARHGFTLDRVASELGISRRMAAYYKKQARVPRVVALACRYIDDRARVKPVEAQPVQGWPGAIISMGSVQPFDEAKRYVCDFMREQSERKPTYWIAKPSMDVTTLCVKRVSPDDHLQFPDLSVPGLHLHKR